MNGNAEEASERQHRSIVILSDRSREIIRLFEELQRKRQQAGQGRHWDGGGNWPGMHSHERRIRSTTPA